MTIYICGNSHMAVLASEFKREDYKDLRISAFCLGNGKFEATPFSARRGRRTIFLIEEYAQNLTKYTGRAAISKRAIWGFCNINHNARIYRDPMWLRYEPAIIAKPGMQAVSDNVLNEFICRDATNIQRFFEQIKACGIETFAISAPFPREDHPCIKAGVRKDVVNYIDHAARQMWTRWLAENGIPYIAPPEETGTKHGFLKTEYNAPPLRTGVPDHHHAGPAYGALMCRRIADFVGKSGLLTAREA